MRTFRNPKVMLEQYPTGAHLAARMLYTIEHTYGDIQERIVVDLGCGPGMLSMGCAVLEADQVIGVDIDPDALAVCRENCTDFEGIEVALELVEADVFSFALNTRVHADTVVTNPPFGTKRKGADMEFLEAAFMIPGVTAVYSLHKSSTRKHVEKAARALGAEEAEVVAEMRYDLPASYKFHKHKSKDIEVDCWRFQLPHDKDVEKIRARVKAARQETSSVEVDHNNNNNNNDDDDDDNNNNNNNISSVDSIDLDKNLKIL